MELDAYHVLLSLSVFSIGTFVLFLAFFAFGARRILRTDGPVAAARAPSDRPAVTLLKPCAGTDDDLERCLESYCAVNYPEGIQIIFGVRDTDDSAYPIVCRVQASHPELDIEVVVEARVGKLGRHPSPKVSNLHAMYARTKHALIWLSDSNTRVHPDTLTAMVDDLLAPGVGMVVSPIVGDDEVTAGSVFETSQLNCQVAKWTYIIHGLTRLMIAPGKSSLLRRETLDAVGGWDELGRYFGEDFILFERVRAMGMRIELGQHLVTNVSVRSTAKKFLVRHLRWVQIRWRVTFITTALEPLIEPELTAGLLALLFPSHLTFAILLLAVSLQLVGDGYVMRRLRGHPMRPSQLLLLLMRPLLTNSLWWRSMFDRRVEWRGRQFWMGPQSTLLTEPPLRSRLRAVRDALRGSGA